MSTKLWIADDWQEKVCAKLCFFITNTDARGRKAKLENCKRNMI